MERRGNISGEARKGVEGEGSPADGDTVASADAAAPLPFSSTRSDAAPANLKSTAIENHPRYPGALRRQASTLLSIQQADPRTAGIFATQQRWLMAHLALAMHFESRDAATPDAFRASTFIAAVVARGVASRNTADAFVKEMLKYGYVGSTPGRDDRRVRALAVAGPAIMSLESWLRAHLETLDALDGGGRLAAFAARPGSIARIHPRIAEGLLSSRAIRDPAPTFSLFTWLNEGGVVMDWLYAGVSDFGSGSERVATSVASLAEFGERIRLSRSHLTRKLRAAEDMGSLGWTGERGRSTMWVSASFLGEYHAQQSAKLAIIDRAFRQSVAA